MEGVIITPLKIIYNSKGDILHGMKKSDKGFNKFGEAYFSTVMHNEIKGWNRHSKMILNLIVPFGEVTFVIYNQQLNTYFDITLSLENYQRLTIFPGLWIGFKGISSSTNLILNIASIEHDPNDLKKLDLDKIPYNWS
jgi:dTDP-4-dehydrorhamnose 3,5-epimerase